MSLALNTVVYNEAPRIADMLAMAAWYCDELVVVDQHSTDGTADIAKDFGATVILDTHYGYCEPSRPVAAQNTNSEYILVLDADEQIAPQFVPRMPKLDCLAARFKVSSYVDGHRIDPVIHTLDPARNGRYHPNPQVRYFKKGTVTFGTGLHTRIEYPFEGIYEPDDEGWILNLKTQAEWEFDDARYRELTREA